MSAEVVQLKTKTAEEWFDEFWKASPIKKEKPLTRQKFMALVSPEGLTTKIKDRETGELIEIHYEQQDPYVLVEQMKAYYRRQLDKDYKISPYTVHPATWLNRGRWQDQ